MSLLILVYLCQNIVFKSERTLLRKQKLATQKYALFTEFSMIEYSVIKM